MSRSIRLFVEAPLHAGGVVPGSAGQAHYLAAVMRRAVGDRVALFNGAEGEWTARIAALARGAVRFEVLAPTRPQEAEPDLWLCFALLKREATDLVVEKATELGVSRLRPVLTERTQAARVNLDRLRAIAAEAAEQCERLSVPAIDPPLPLAELLAAWPPARPLAVAMERGAAPPLRPGAGALLVGPEGGFSGRELDVLRRQPFVALVTIGPRILRAETAAIAGLALMQAGGPA